VCAFFVVFEVRIVLVEEIPLVRYEVWCEHSLVDPELYRKALVRGAGVDGLLAGSVGGSGCGRSRGYRPAARRPCWVCLSLSLPNIVLLPFSFCVFAENKKQ
jgi:hypothetical protein